jgi:hypothetical protein
MPFSVSDLKVAIEKTTRLDWRVSEEDHLFDGSWCMLRG